MRQLICVLLLACCLPSCATYHATTWAYGSTRSIHGQPDEFSERAGLRAVVGIPLILVSAVWDAATWEIQAITGCWPFWGSSSQHFKPEEKRV